MKKRKTVKILRYVFYALAVGFVAVPLAIAMSGNWVATEMQALLFLDVLAPVCLLTAQGLRIWEKKQDGQSTFTNTCICFGIVVGVLPQIIMVLSQK